MYEGEQLDNPIEPQGKNKTQNHRETQASEDRRNLQNENAPEPPAENMRFELEDENYTNGWDLPLGLVAYLHK